MNDLTKNIILWIVIAIVLLTVFSELRHCAPAQPDTVEYSAFLDRGPDRRRSNSVDLRGRHHQGRARPRRAVHVTFSPETDNTALIGELKKNKRAH